MMASHDKKGPRKLSLQNSDPGKVMELVRNMTDDYCSQLQIKINTYFQQECEADLVVLIEVHTSRMEAWIETIGATALARKHTICMSQVFLDAMKSSFEVVELLSNTGEHFLNLVTPHISKDYGKKRVVITPIIAEPFSVLVCVVAPKILERLVATMVNECFLFIWPVLKKSIALEFESTLKHKCQDLLKVARRLFTRVVSLETLLQIVMEQAKQLTRAEYCFVYLIDVEKMELVETYFEGNSKGVQEAVERRLPMGKGILGQVLTTGYLANIKDISKNTAFDKSIDEHEGKEIKTMLCFPIRDQSGIIGVGQLINKIDDPYFGGMDEEMALAFSIYCGVCIVHSIIYEKMQEAHIRNALANELVMYHMKVGDGEIARVAECRGFHQHPHMATLNFNPRALPLRELPCYAVKMFVDLGFDKLFNIKMTKLIRFVLHVKKGYRDVAYHNWLHAFSVGQWAYGAIINFKLVKQGYLSDLQAFMYLISGLVHDLDHRGTTNSFQIQGQTTLASLYSSEGSVMERHHLAQAICILNMEGCDILEALPRRDYDRALLMLRDYVLASDLANYFKNAQTYQAIAQDYQKGNRVHCSALQAILMNCADLSDQIKEWSAIKKTAVAVLTEFFNQGELEKSRGEHPTLIMDRDKCFIPELQIQFMATVCKPLFQLLGRFIPKAEACCYVIDTHIEKWDASKPIFAEVPITAGLSVLVSSELDNLIELNIAEKERLRLEEEAAAKDEEGT